MSFGEGRLPSLVDALSPLYNISPTLKIFDCYDEFW